MSDSPFNIQALHLEKDMNARVSVATQKVEIPAHTFIEHCEKRELSALVRGRRQKIEIIVPADFYLDMSNAPNKKTKDKSQLLLPLALVGGIALGILAFAPFLIEINFAWALTAFLTFAIGCQCGWVSHRNAKERQEEFFNKVEAWVSEWKQRTSLD